MSAPYEFVLSIFLPTIRRETYRTTHSGLTAQYLIKHSIEIIFCQDMCVKYEVQNGKL